MKMLNNIGPKIDDAISVHIPTSNSRYKDLQKEITGTDENVMDYITFLSSQRSLGRKDVNQSHSVSDSEGYEDRSNISKTETQRRRKLWYWEIPN